MSAETSFYLGAPGAGKTSKVREIVSEKIKEGVPSRSIMYNTFRREAVINERNNLSVATGLSINDLKNVRTIHGVCFSLLLKEGIVKMKKDENPVMQLSDYNKFNHDCGYHVNPGRITVDEMFSSRNDPYLSFYSVMKATRTPFNNLHTISADFMKISYDELKSFVKTFDTWKADNNKIGFDDMPDMVLSENLTIDCPIQIYDEAQDWNTQHYELAKLWTSEADEVSLAGDPLQTIYTYMGATPAYLMDWEAELIVLPESKRLPANVWALASELISLKTPYKTPEIITKKENGIMKVIDHTNMINWLKDTPKNPNSIVFHLVRTAYTGYDVAKALAVAGIPFTGLRDYAWRNEEINLYNAIKVIQNNTRSLTEGEFCAIVNAYPEEYFISSFSKQSIKEKIDKRGNKTLITALQPNPA